MHDKRKADFWKFLSGQTISTFGSSFTGVALPLLVYQLTHSPINLALSFAASRLPYLVFGLIGGAYADRVERKPLMIRTDLLNAATIASIPLLYFLHMLPLWWIYAVIFLGATFDILFQAAGSAVVPSLVSTNELVEANGRFYAASNTALLLGPTLAGILFGFMPTVNVLLFDALSYIISALSLAWIHTSFNSPSVASKGNDQPKEQRSMRQDIVEGLRYIWEHPVLRYVVLLLALVNIQVSISFAEFVFFAKEQLNATNFQYGLLAASGSVGVVLFSLVARHLRQHLSFGHLALSATAAGSIAFIAFALTQSVLEALPLWLLRAGLFALVDVSIISLRQAIVPNRLLGRVVTSSRVIGSSLAPLAALLGGYVVALTNVTVVYVGVGILTLLVCGGFVFSPLGRSNKELETTVSTEKFIPG
jgi:Transmembrane secretion effector